MGFIDLFPTVIFSKNIKDNNIFSYINFIKNEKFELSGEKNGYYSNNSNILNEYIFSNLKQTILKNVLLYLKEVGHEVEDIQISNSWANVLNKNQEIHNHIHANSYISGVFYLTESSSIKFNNPLLREENFCATKIFNENNYRTYTEYYINPTPGLLLIFPSWLDHSAVSSETDNRISIAFNIIPKGKFGFPTAQINL